MKQKNYVIIAISEDDGTSEVIAVTKNFKKGEKYILEMNDLISKVSKLYLDFLSNEYILWKKENPLPIVKSKITSHHIQSHEVYHKKYNQFLESWINTTFNLKEKEIYEKGLINTVYFIKEVDEL